MEERGDEFDIVTISLGVEVFHDALKSHLLELVSPQTHEIVLKIIITTGQFINYHHLEEHPDNLS